MIKIKKIAAAVTALSVSASLLSGFYSDKISNAVHASSENLQISKPETLYFSIDTDKIDPLAITSLLKENNISAVVKKVGYSSPRSLQTYCVTPDKSVSAEYVSALIYNELGYVSKTRSIFAEETFSTALPSYTDSSDLIISYDGDEILYGDLNLDKVRDLTDLTILSLYVIGDRQLDKPILEAADVQYDHEVNLADLAQLKRYLSHKESKLGKQELVYTDITDSCSEYLLSFQNAPASPLYNYESFTISSMNEYTEYIEKYGKDISLIENFNEISDDFFLNNCMIYTYEYDTRYGIETTVSSVKRDQYGDVVLSHDRFLPSELQLNFSSEGYYIVDVIPKECTIKGKLTRIENELNDTSEFSLMAENYENITSECSAETRFRVIETDKKLSCTVKSREELDEVNKILYENSNKSIVDLFPDLELSDEFFEENTLFICNFSENTGSIRYTSPEVLYNRKKNEVLITADRQMPYYGPVTADIGRWLITAVIPNSLFSEEPEYRIYINNVLMKDAFRDITEKSVIRTIRTENNSEKNYDSEVFRICSLEEYEELNNFMNGAFDYLKGSLNSIFFKHNVLYITMSTGTPESITDVTTTSYGLILTLQKHILSTGESSSSFIYHNIVSVPRECLPYEAENYSYSADKLIHTYYTEYSLSNIS